MRPATDGSHREEVEGKPLEVRAGEDEVGRRAEDEGRPPDVVTPCRRGGGRPA